MKKNIFSYFTIKNTALMFCLLLLSGFLGARGNTNIISSALREEKDNFEQEVLSSSLENLIDEKITKLFSSGLTVDAFQSAGVVHNDASGTLSTSLIVNSDIASGTITTTQIANNTIINSDIANNTITAAQIANNTITGTQIATTASISDSMLATLVTAGKVANSATTATSSDVVNTLVARDASGNFSAGTITANLLNIEQVLTLAGVFSATLASSGLKITVSSNVSVIILTKTFVGTCSVTINLSTPPVQGQLLYIIALTSGVGTGTIALQTGGTNFTIPGINTLSTPAGSSYIYTTQNNWVPIN